ncbi:MAG: cytochrome c-type biogenesis protein CcmH [Deltaproteobacteria bacterium]|nr:cytochrome c-type biogenesis protein CcmH [Deltaproteobacteria bacterium]
MLIKTYPLRHRLKSVANKSNKFLSEFRRNFLPSLATEFIPWRLTIFILVTFLLVWTACAQSPLTPEERAERIGKQLRCPVCRGVPIAESPSTLAVEMMTVVRAQVQAGKSDEEILKYFEERYGEWVLLEPKPEGMNLAIWLLPLLVFLGGGVFIVVAANKKKKEEK